MGFGNIRANKFICSYNYYFICFNANSQADTTKPLKEYSVLVQRVRDNMKSSHSIEEAMKKGVDDCIRDNILKDFLELYGKEVTGMCLTEFDEEKFRQMLIEECREETKRVNAKNLIGIISDELIAEKIGLPLEEVQAMHE